MRFNSLTSVNQPPLLERVWSSAFHQVFLALAEASFGQLMVRVNRQNGFPEAVSAASI